jgi:C1A family cysteine protease
MENTVSQDAGAMIRDGIKSVATLGVCPESNCKYVTKNFRRKPSKRAYANALKRKVSSYQRITTFDDMKNCLANGNPFVFGFTVYSSFMSDAVAATGKMPMPAKTESVEGGHAVLCVGYDDDMQCMIVRNSWGTGWGDKGYFYMPYAYIKNSNLCDDMWTVTL